jgi:hypothetical protein
MLESKFQTQLIKEIKRMIPGCVVLKNDASYLQGVPDLLVLYRNRWAMLEVKASEDAHVGPNQLYYIDMFGSMSFSAFIYPENKKEILDDLQHALTFRR